MLRNAKFEQEMKLICELTRSKTNDINNIRCEISMLKMEVAGITTAIIMKNLILCLSPLLEKSFP